MTFKKMILQSVAIIACTFVISKLCAVLDLPQNVRTFLPIACFVALRQFLRFGKDDKTTSSLVGQKAPALPENLVMIKGKKPKIEGPCVIEFWATWCPPCRSTIPHLAELYNKHKEKIDFLAISKEEADVLRKFMKDDESGKKICYPVASGDVQAYPVGAIPTSYVINESGNICWTGHPSELEEGIKLAFESPKKD